MVDTGHGPPIATYDFGGEGLPLLVVHATGFHAHVYLPMIEVLRASFHCYGVDLRGHGATPPPEDGDFDWRSSARDVLAAQEALGISPCYGFGHSCGGAVGVLAEELRPGSSDGLYLYEPIIPSPSMFELPAPATGANVLATGALRRRPDFANRQEAFDNYAAKPPLSSFTPAALRAYVDHGFIDRPDGTVTLACRPESEAATFMASAHHHAWDRLPQVGCSVTIAYGEHPSAFPAAHHEALAARIPGGRALMLAGLDHFGPMTHPGIVARSLVAALGDDSA